MNLFGLNIQDQNYLSFVEFVMVDDHLQCYEELFNENEFISGIVNENDDLANGFENDQEKRVMQIRKILR